MGCYIFVGAWWKKLGVWCGQEDGMGWVYENIQRKVLSSYDDQPVGKRILEVTKGSYDSERMHYEVHWESEICIVLCVYRRKEGGEIYLGTKTTICELVEIQKPSTFQFAVDVAEGWE